MDKIMTDQEKYYVSHKNALSNLAKWSVWQSPYDFPENLQHALFCFSTEWKNHHNDYFTIFNSYDELYKTIDYMIKKISYITDWNSPKIGNPEFMIVSRYDQPKPDYDFIDLDALVRNVVTSIIKEQELS